MYWLNKVPTSNMKMQLIETEFIITGPIGSLILQYQ